jgi:RNA polymerase sigma-B factor
MSAILDQHAQDGPAGPQLSDAELLTLVRSRPAGDPDREAACEILVGRYANIVSACVARYRDSPESAEDLAQVGYVGLMKAINNFDPAVGDSLAAYAQPCVSGEIKRHFRDKRWHIRVQRQAQELRLRINAASGELTQELARTPTDRELAVHLGVAEAEVTEAQLASQVLQVASLDTPLPTDSSEGGSLADFVGADDPLLEHTLDIDAVWQHCAELPEREQRMLMMRFYGNMTQAQIGEELGMSQMHVSRLLSHALSYLRDRITSDEPPGTGEPADGCETSRQPG